MKHSIVVGSLVTVLAIASSVYAHHAAAGVDRTKTVTVEGTVKSFKWQNPHSYMEVEVPNGKGGADLWSLEMTSPAFLVRAGWKSTSLKPGDKVTARANPMKDGTPGGLFVSVTLPDGKTLSERAPAAAAPAPAR